MKVPTTTNAENNKRIAKNTLFLYFRNLLSLGVGLYTSREVLAQLGVSDFGIYNVVGGVILLFSFIQSAMNNATSRFFTFDLGKGDFEQLKKTFSLSVIIHIFTALLILILGETIGLWFLNTQLVIPEDKMGAANFVYQFSVFTACVGIFQMPYMVAINAHERMKVFAYAGIADAVFKLSVAIALGFAPIDKLKFYSVLLFGVCIVMAVFYTIYCHRNFTETHFKFIWDREMFLERITFGGWSFLTGIASIVATYGGIFLINIFYGVLLNSALGVANQVSNAVNQFALNFHAAINPQITKSFASGNIDYYYSIITRAIKFSILLFFLFMFPLILQIDFILNLWLKNVPEWANIFCQLGLINTVICFAFAPLWTGIFATGNIKWFQIIDCGIIALIFLFTYIGLHYSPAFYLISHIIANIFRAMLALFFINRLSKFPVKNLFPILGKISVITVISISLPFLINSNIKGFAGFFATTVSFVLLFVSLSLFFALTKNERNYVLSLAKKAISTNHIN